MLFAILRRFSKSGHFFQMSAAGALMLSSSLTFVVFLFLFFLGQVGATKADRKTRRPEWNQNFLVRSDLLAETHSPADDDDEFDDDDNDDGKYECEYSRGRRDEHEHQHYPDAAVKESFDSDRRKDTQCAADLGADFGADLNDAGPDEFAADSGGDGVDSADEVGDDKSSANSQGNRTNVAPATRAAAVACGRCRACRKRGTEIVLEVWDQYIPDQELDRMGGMGGAGGGITGEGGRQRRRRKRSSVGKPNDLFGRCAARFCGVDCGISCWGLRVLVIMRGFGKIIFAKAFRCCGVVRR